MNRFYSVGLVGLLALSLASAQAAPQGTAEAQKLPAILKKALETAGKHRFTGTRIVEFRRMGATTRYTEVVTRDGDFTRIDYPTGSPFAGQIVVENSKERRHFFPDKNEIFVMPPRREEALGRLARMVTKDARFRISTADGANVAGLRTSQIVVSDRDGNVVQRIFIEPRSGLLLKRQMFDAVGTQVGLYEFTQINLNPRIDSRVFTFVRRGAKIVRPIDILRKHAQEKSLPFAFLKPSSGFNLYFSNVKQIEGQDVQIQFYGSDHGRVSLYLMKAAIDPAKLSHQSRGKVNVHTWDDRGTSFVLIGNQTPETLRKLAIKVVFGN